MKWEMKGQWIRCKHNGLYYEVIKHFGLCSLVLSIESDQRWINYDKTSTADLFREFEFNDEIKVVLNEMEREMEKLRKERIAKRAIACLKTEE